MKEDDKIPEFSLLGGPLQWLGCRLGLVREGTNTVWLGVALGLLAWVYTLPIHELKKGVKLGDTFG